MLFVWGRQRVLPVRISSLKIDETLYNATLNPVRAEIEASLEVLGDADAKNDAIVNAALEHTTTSRRAALSTRQDVLRQSRPPSLTAPGPS